jgi:hypothetical protein
MNINDDPLKFDAPPPVAMREMEMIFFLGLLCKDISSNQMRCHPYSFYDCVLTQDAYSYFMLL